jgi:hypothetical protein
MSIERQLFLLFSNPSVRSSGTGVYGIDHFLKQIEQELSARRSDYNLKGIPIEYEQMIKRKDLCWYTKMFLFLSWLCCHDNYMKEFMKYENEWIRMHFPVILRQIFERTLQGLNIHNGQRIEWIDKKKMIRPPDEYLMKQQIQYIVTEIIDIYMEM